MASDTRPKRPDKVREKVMLKPGFHLGDWVRLSQAIGVKPLRKITRTELALHNSQYDCWTAYKGKVYDVTQYLPYHPGGMPKLMLGAGNDCTAMYNKYHPWVNAETMLAKCMIGILVAEEGEETSKSTASEIGAIAETTLDAATAAVAVSTSSPHNKILSAFDERACNDDVDDINIFNLSLTRFDTGNSGGMPSSSSSVQPNTPSSSIAATSHAQLETDVHVISHNILSSCRSAMTPVEDENPPASVDNGNNATKRDEIVPNAVISSDKDG